MTPLAQRAAVGDTRSAPVSPIQALILAPLERRTAVRYGMALAVIALVLCFKLQFTPLYQTPYPLFLGAVLFSAWFGGIGPGLLATALAAVAIDYFFLQPLFA